MKKKCVSCPASASVRASPAMRTPNPPACEYRSGPSKDTRTNKKLGWGSGVDACTCFNKEATCDQIQSASMDSRASGGAAVLPHLLAGDAGDRVRDGIEPLITDPVPAFGASPVAVRRPVQTTEPLIDVPEQASLAAGEQKALLALERVAAFIRHVETPRPDFAVGFALTDAVGVSELLELRHGPPAFIEKPTLEVLELGLSPAGLRSEERRVGIECMDGMWL